MPPDPQPFVATGAYPTRTGNHVRPWVDGEPAFRRICETIEAARHSVRVTVAFMWPSFHMPDGRGAPLDMLERAARRGLDVRLIFWRPDEDMVVHRRHAFWGSPAHFEALSQGHPHLKIRWDRAAPGYCQHQKTWLLDGDSDGAVAFVGGINLNPHSLAAPGHDGVGGQNHDVYVELTGPAVADVQHNFVQRWNEASERHREDGRWGNDLADDLPFPRRTPPVCGAARVQIQRTTHRGRYANGHGFDIASGERTNLDQYCAAIKSARRAIYMENQYLDVSEIVAELGDALARGVEVVFLLPAVPDLAAWSTMTDERKEFLAARAALSAHDNFTLAGIAGLGTAGRRQPVYVHSKLMIIDDDWMTVGSCNLHHYSLFGNGELNLAVRDPAAVRAMRTELFSEHLARDTSGLGQADAQRLFRRITQENRRRHERGDPNWQGLAFSLDGASYGQMPQF